MIIEAIPETEHTLPKLKITISSDELVDLLRKNTLCEPFEIKVPTPDTWTDIEVVINLDW